MATQPTDTAKPRVKAAGDELTAIAQRAQAFTNASGTAIALSGGNADEIICRARSGAAAPEVGTALRVEGSFTGLCIQSGKELRCDDAETDTRVDMAAIRALGIRSMVVTPIRDENKVVGVLACFAPTAHAFTITHVAVLKTMGDQISVILQKERRAREEGPAPDVARTSAPEIAVVQPAPVAPAAPPPVVIKPATVSSNGAAAAAAPARSSFPVVSKVDPVPFPKKEEKKSEARTSFGTLDSVGWEGKKAGVNFKILAAVAVLVVAAGGTFAFLKMHKSGTSAAAKQTQEATSPNTSTAQTQPQQTQQAQATSSTSPVAASGNAAPAPADNTSSAATNHAARTSAPPAVVENRQPDHSAQRSERPAPTPVTLSSGPSQIKANEGQSVDVAPALTVAGGSTPGSLSALARPVGAAPAAALAQSELEPLKLLKSVPPIYPAIAKVRRLSGQVIVEVTVGKDGKTHNPKFVGGQPVFRDAAFEAVKQWVFKPAKLNGQPIEQTTQIKVDFHP